MIIWTALGHINSNRSFSKETFSFSPGPLMRPKMTVFKLKLDSFAGNWLSIKLFSQNYNLTYTCSMHTIPHILLAAKKAAIQMHCTDILALNWLSYNSTLSLFPHFYSPLCVLCNLFTLHIFVLLPWYQICVEKSKNLIRFWKETVLGRIHYLNFLRI